MAVRLAWSVELQYQIGAGGGTFICNLHAAATAQQAILVEQLDLSQAIPVEVFSAPGDSTRFMRLCAAPGQLRIAYAATVEVSQHVVEPGQIPEVDIARLPPAVIPYLYPSRYCQSDRLNQLAVAEFGQLPRGYSRVLAIQQWVRRQVKFTMNSSNASTSALDTLNDRVGVCRDFTHLMIALCRAVGIPARFATGIDYGADPVLGPTDFHAYVEAWLGDRWYIFDPSDTAIPMGFVRIGTGRDAADVAFATIFGPVTANQPRISIRAVTDGIQGLVVPQRRREALSTAA